MPPGSTKATRHTTAGEISVRTERRTQLLDVTAGVAKMVQDSGVQSGICYVDVPHTTAAVLINESDDPAVAADIEGALARLVSQRARVYRDRPPAETVQPKMRDGFLNDSLAVADQVFIAARHENETDRQI